MVPFINENEIVMVKSVSKKILLEMWLCCIQMVILKFIELSK